MFDPQNIIGNHLFILCTDFGFISIIAGFIMYKYPPRKINPLYGYRTSASTKSQERWDFSQRYSAKLMMLIGLINLIMGMISFFLKINEILSLILALLVLVLSCVFLFAKVETSLNKRFPKEN